jgi:hypothetical protein
MLWTVAWTARGAPRVALIEGRENAVGFALHEMRRGNTVLRMSSGEETISFENVKAPRFGRCAS